MYGDILKEILDTLENFGTVKYVCLSEEVLMGMTKKQRTHLEDLLFGPIKWVVDSNNKDFRLVYDIEPYDMILY